jgi:hypothetical protein
MSEIVPDQRQRSHLELKDRLEVNGEKAISFRPFLAIFSLRGRTDEQNLPIKLLSTTNEYYLPNVTKPNKRVPLLPSSSNSEISLSRKLVSVRISLILSEG